MAALSLYSSIPASSMPGSSTCGTFGPPEADVSQGVPMCSYMNAASIGFTADPSATGAFSFRRLAPIPESEASDEQRSADSFETACTGQTGADTSYPPSSSRFSLDVSSHGAGTSRSGGDAYSLASMTTGCTASSAAPPTGYSQPGSSLTATPPGTGLSASACTDQSGVTPRPGYSACALSDSYGASFTYIGKDVKPSQRTVRGVNCHRFVTNSRVSWRSSRLRQYYEAFKTTARGTRSAVRQGVEVARAPRDRFIEFESTVRPDLGTSVATSAC